MPDPPMKINRARVTLSGALSRFDSLNTLEINDVDGTLNILEGRGFSAPNGFVNRGEMSVIGGTFSTPSLTNQAAAKLVMTGALAGALVNHGALSIAGDQVGALIVEHDIVLGEESTLALGIGTVSDQLIGAADLSLGGLLSISLIPGQRAGALRDGVFELVDVAGIILGAFANVASGERLALEGGEGSFEIRYGEGEFANRVVAMNFVPEPGTAILIAFGLIGLAARRRLRSSG
jgi:hypothetical protein